jgi:hypothetical protein
MQPNFKFTNAVRIHGKHPDGRAREVVAHNTLTYAAADVMVAALLQSGPSKVTYLYAQHGGSTNTAPVVLPTDMRATTQSNFTSTIVGYDNGGLWIPLMTAPAVDSTDVSSYRGNLATYYFRIPGTLPIAQFTGNFVPGTSLIYGLGLAVTVNTSDRSQDLIISALGNGAFTPFVVASNGQEAIDYPLQITIPSP